MTDAAMALLSELRAIDDREDQILDVLLRHGAALEESERRLNMVTIADLRALRDGLASLEPIIEAVRADVARAEAAATPTLPTNGATNGHDAPASATRADAAAATPTARATPADTTPPAATTPTPQATASPAIPAPEAAPATPGTTPVAATPPGAPAPATPAISMTFEQIQAWVRRHDAEGAEIMRTLHDRLVALGAKPVETGTPGAAALPIVSDLAAALVPVSAPPSPSRTFQLGDTGADVKRFQRDLNARFEAWGIHIRVDEDGKYLKATRHAAHQCLLGLGVDPADYAHGITPRLRVLIRKPSTRTAHQIAQAQARRPWLRRLRAREAGAQRTHATGTTTRAPGARMARASAPRTSGVAAAIEAHRGRYADIIVHEAKRHGLPVELVCAVIEHESGFRNVYGHDPVSNPIKSPAKGLLDVTEANYKAYLQHRKARQGCQGVGPMQLTSSGLQDRADALGGCWEVGPNIRVGCEFLANNIKRLGSTRQGVRAYNGSGPAAERYATDVLKLRDTWRTRLAGAKTAASATTHAAKRSTATPGAPRTFKLAKKPMTGDDVRRFQHDLNSRFAIWKIESRISEDGRYGATTQHAAKQVMHGLGFAAADDEHGITPQLRSKIRTPSLRTSTEVARAGARAGYVAALRKKANAKGGGALRLRAYAEARRMLDVREVGGNNQGTMVMQIIKANGGSGPEAWCGDFVAWCYRRAGSKAVTRDWANVAALGRVAGVKRTKSPLKGNLVRYGAKHIGMFVCWCDSRGNEVAMAGASHFKTIEGNTTPLGATAVSDAGGGEGVYTKIRPRGSHSDFLHITR